MPGTKEYSRLNIYLDHPDLRKAVKIAAARSGVTVSAYCVEAIRRRLGQEGYPFEGPANLEAKAAARALDELRQKVGPIGVPVRELIAEGRRR